MGHGKLHGKLIIFRKKPGVGGYATMDHAYRADFPSYGGYNQSIYP
jgi:hypothetical protein